MAADPCGQLYNYYGFGVVMEGQHRPHVAKRLTVIALAVEPTGGAQC